MIAIEHAIESKADVTKIQKINKDTFAYRKLPVIPFVAPRTKKN